MISWVESATTSYAETVANAIPLHRALLLVFAILIIVAYNAGVTSGVLPFLFSISVIELLSIDNSLIKNTNVGEIVIGVAVVTTAAIYARLLTRVLFLLASRSTSLVKKISSQELTSSSLTISDRKQAIELIENSLDITGKRIRRANQLGELTAGCGIVLIGVGAFGSTIDLAVGVVSVIASAAILTYSTKLFISDYFGAATYAARLQGKEVPKPDDL